MSHRPIEQKAFNRQMRTIRKGIAARHIPFSGVEYPRGTPERRAQNRREKQLDNVLMLLLHHAYLAYQQKRKAVFV